LGIALLTLAAAGTLALLATTLLSYAPREEAWMRSHFLLALGSTFLLVMAHSFVMFFLIATGVELKDIERARGWGDSFRRRTVAMKSRVFPLMTSALLLVIVNFMMGAAAHTHAVPGWVHQALAWLTLAVSLAALWREYVAIGDNNRLIAEAASRREDTNSPPAG
jgi:hypothetical protein